VEIKAIHELPKTVLATGAQVVRISDRNDRLRGRGGGAAGGPSSALATTWDAESAGAAAPAGPVGGAPPEGATVAPDIVSGTAPPMGEVPGVLGAASMPPGRRVPTGIALGHIGEEESSASSKNTSVFGS